MQCVEDAYTQRSVEFIQVSATSYRFTLSNMKRRAVFLPQLSFLSSYLVRRMRVSK